MNITQSKFSLTDLFLIENPDGTFKINDDKNKVKIIGRIVVDKSKFFRYESEIFNRLEVTSEMIQEMEDKHKQEIIEGKIKSTIDFDPFNK